MEKNIYVYRNYEDCVKNNLDFFQSYYYHSILDLNLVKLSRILDVGLLSRHGLKDVCLYTEPLTSYSCKNGSDYISISECLGRFPLNILFHSFVMHVLSCPSIMISKDLITRSKVQNTCYGFDDELFVLDKIDKEKFKAILLPEHLSNQLISETNPVVHNWVCLKKEYIGLWINLVEEYFSIKLDRDKFIKMIEEMELLSKKYYDQKYYRLNEMATITLAEQKDNNGINLKELMAETLQELWNQRLDKDNVTYLDVVKYINKDELPIYKLTRKRVIRINE